MKISVTKITKTFFIWLSLAAVVISISNKVLNTHLHQLSDGTVVQHAHPYQKSNDTKPFQSHTHSASELIFLHFHFNALFVFLFAAFIFIQVAKVVVNFLAVFQRNYPVYLGPKQGRSPPIG